MIHALIVGAKGVGKSTLIRRVLQELARPVAGFETKKEDSMKDDLHGIPVYIYEPEKPRIHSKENLAGYCTDHGVQICDGIFDNYAPKLKQTVPDDSILVFDELGFMESQEKDFCEAVLNRLGGEIPVIAAVKDRDIPFLIEVRSHPHCRCFYITEENREELFPEVLEFFRSQLPSHL